MQTKLISLFVILCIATGIHAQTKFYNAETLSLFGTLAKGSAHPFQRLPDSLRTVSRKAVWDLSTSTAGLYIRFSSNTSSVVAKWKVTQNTVMNHMAMVGIKGVDLYCYENNNWRFVNSAIPRAKTTQAVIISHMAPKQREFMLYLPLYDGIDSLMIGVDSLSSVSAPQINSPKAERPLVVYGTSITQGGCSSRPGMSYVSILERILDRQAINLGFSGNGRLDYEIARVMATCDASCFVIDCVPNCIEAELKERLKPFIAILRKAHPTTPIVLVEGPHFPNAEFDLASGKLLKGKADAMISIYKELIEKGDKNLYFQPSEKLIGTDGEATVDGVHFTDLGHLRFAEGLYPLLRKLIK
jgi:hypothetical protein